MSGFDVDLTITGIQELQAANLRRFAALRPTGAVGRALKWGTACLYNHLVAITHVDTGSLKGSRRLEIVESRSRLFTDPSTVNPRSKVRPVVYDEYEEARGGEHAAWQRTYREKGPYVVTRMSAIIVEGLE